MKNLILSFLVLGALLISCSPEVLNPRFNNAVCDKEATGVVSVEVDNTGSTVVFIDLVNEKGLVTERVQVTRPAADLESGAKVSLSYRVQLSVGNNNSYSGSCGDDDDAHSTSDPITINGTPTVEVPNIFICDHEILP